MGFLHLNVGKRLGFRNRHTKSTRISWLPSLIMRPRLLPRLKTKLKIVLALYEVENCQLRSSFIKLMIFDIGDFVERYIPSLILFFLQFNFNE